LNYFEPPYEKVDKNISQSEEASYDIFSLFKTQINNRIFHQWHVTTNCSSPLFYFFKICHTHTTAAAAIEFPYVTRERESTLKSSRMVIKSAKHFNCMLFLASFLPYHIDKNLLADVPLVLAFLSPLFLLTSQFLQLKLPN
jgi:hypothetical protein